MDCKRFEPLLEDCLGGALIESTRLEAEEHLRSCPACRLRLKVVEDCRTLNEEDEVPVSFIEGYRERIMKEETLPEKKTTKLTRWLAVAAAFVFVAGGTILAGRNRINNAPDPAAPPESGYATESDTSMRGAGEMYASVPDMANAPMSSAAGKQASAEEQTEKIIRTVQLELTTRSFSKDYDVIRETVLASGGRIQEANLRIGYGDLRTAYMTLRVPVGKLDALTASVKDAGRLVSFNESAEDVSEQYADVTMRLQTQKTKMERLQALLLKAESVEDLIAVESGISDTQYEIDRLTGQLLGMDSRVEYSTMNLTLRELSAAQTSQDKEETLPERIRNGIAAAWKTFSDILGDLAVFLTVALPYLLALAVIILVIRTIMKRRKK